MLFNCVQYIVASLIVSKAECDNPYPEIASVIEEKGCLYYGWNKTYRDIMIAVTVLLTFYIKYIVYASLFEEKERIRRQKIQLNNYFMSQSNGIVVLKQKSSRKDSDKLLFCNNSFQKLTGLKA